MQYTTKYNSKIGEILLASDGERLTGLWFTGQKYFADNLKDKCVECNLPIFEQTKEWLDIYFSGKIPKFIPQLSFENVSLFRKRVLEILLEIPYGKTSTYGLIAKEIEKVTRKKVSAQAVGGAIGHNPISIIIPCHRVIGTNKSLTGYAGGIDKKIMLLEIEGVDIFKLKIPTIRD